MRYILLLSMMIAGIQSMGQDTNIFPRNHAGAIISIDASNMSATVGLEYERILVTKNQFAAGIRGSIYKPYKTANADISFTGYVSPYHADFTISLQQLYGTGYFFTSSTKQLSGFFFSAGLGLTNSVAKKREESSYGNNHYKNLLPGVELGTGVQFATGMATSFRGMLTASFSGKQDAPRADKISGSFVLLSAKIQIGF